MYIKIAKETGGGGGYLKKGFVRVFNDKANKKISTGTPPMIHR